MSSAPAGKSRKPPATPRPSASILLISPTNQILLLHRVRTSSSFPSAHVFVGGNLSAQDGQIPAIGDARRHEDGPAYRTGAVRECFEESGILLAKRNDDASRLLEVDDETRERGRHDVHEGRTTFAEWVAAQNGSIDTDALVPFTRWITPPNIPKRFTTQMYLYFLPLSNSDATSGRVTPGGSGESLIPPPTSDGGKEHTAARFLSASKWLSMARSGEVILFPPQFFLLHLLDPLLSPPNETDVVDTRELQRQRDRVMEFVASGDPPWTEKCISPDSVTWRKGDGRAVLGLSKPGPELEGSGRRGDGERVVLVNFKKEGPRELEVAWKKDIFRDERENL